MNALISYQFEEEPVRVVMIAGEPWWVANDLCRVLDIKNPRHALARLEEDEKGVALNDPLYSGNTPRGGQQEMNVVSESGMFALVLGSRKAEARRFRKWVTAEVLPSIRRTGKYELAGHEPPPASEFAIDLDPAKAQAAVALIREARRLFGPDHARTVWIDLGLPQPIADATATIEGDPLASVVRDYLSDKAETARAEVARAVGLDAESFADLRRVTTLMKLFGWQVRTVRRGHGTAKRWFSPSALEG